jgi:hypothetical protein
LEEKIFLNLPSIFLSMLVSLDRLSELNEFAHPGFKDKKKNTNPQIDA